MSVLAASSTDVKVACHSTMPQHQCLLPPQGNVHSVNCGQSGSKQGRVSAAAEERALIAEEQVPLVDLAVVRSGDNPEARIAVETIAAACREWGFFQVRSLRLLGTFFFSDFEMGGEFFD